MESARVQDWRGEGDITVVPSVKELGSVNNKQFKTRVEGLLCTLLLIAVYLNVHKIYTRLGKKQGYLPPVCVCQP